MWWMRKILWILTLIVVGSAWNLVSAQETLTEDQPKVETPSPEVDTLANTVANQPPEELKVESLDAGRLLKSSIVEDIAKLKENRAELERDIIREEAKFEVLSEQNGEPVRLAQAKIEVAYLASGLELLEAELSANTSELASVEAQIATLESLEGAAKEREERETKARDAERDAENRVEEALAREAMARDAAMRQLLQRERELAEEVLAATRLANEKISQLEKLEDSETKVYSEWKGKILSGLDEVKEMPPTQAKVDKADALFADVLSRRRVARETLLESFREWRKLESEIASLRESLNRATQNLAAEKARVEEGSSELIKQRIAVAQAEVDLRVKELDTASQVGAFWERRISAVNQRARFYSSTMADMLDLTSSSAQTGLFGFSDETFRDASISFEIAAERVLHWGRQRSAEVMALGFSVDIFTWLFGLATRIVIFLILVFVSLKWLSVGFHWLYERAIRGRTFRRWPGKVATLLEIAFALARPFIVFKAVMYPLEYFTDSFPEFSYAETVIEWVFIYSAINAFARAVFLPRSIRQAEYSVGLGLELQDNISWFDLGEERGRKLVRSARVVALFWLLATLIPAGLREFLGISVLTHVVELSAFLVLALIVYWVIATWRNEIAALFTEIAGPKLPRAVSLVNEHKDRFYGVLIVAAATVYIVVVELVRLGRQYLVDTEWYSTVTNFWFRKRIELQANEKKADLREWQPEDVPSEYRELFSPFGDCPTQSPVVKERDLSSLKAAFEDWRNGREQGSVALVGEVGMGRSTLTSTFASSLESFEVTRLEVSTKSKSKSDTIEEICTLLGIEEPPSTVDELVALILEMEPRVIVLDDCHNMYMRTIGGFVGLDTLLQIVTLTDSKHFWLLTFNLFAWDYVNRVRSRQHMFGKVIRMEMWSREEIQKMIEERHALSGCELSYTEMMVDAEIQDQTAYVDVVKTSSGFFKYLHEFSGGNPRLAMLYWLRSLRLRDENVLEVRLFKRPKTSDVEARDEGHWFVLTAVAQHGALSVEEISEITNLERSFCALAVNYFESRGVTIGAGNGRVKLAPLYFRQVIRHLKNSNFLYS